jgi:hypothetical protein
MNATWWTVCQSQGNVISDAREITSLSPLGNVSHIFPHVAVKLGKNSAFTKLFVVIAHYGVDGDCHLHKMTRPIAKNPCLWTQYTDIKCCCQHAMCADIYVAVITACYFPYEKGTETLKTHTNMILGGPGGTSRTELQLLIARCCLFYLTTLYQIHRLYDKGVWNQAYTNNSTLGLIHTIFIGLCVCMPIIQRPWLILRERHQVIYLKKNMVLRTKQNKYPVTCCWRASQYFPITSWIWFQRDLLPSQNWFFFIFGLFIVAFNCYDYTASGDGTVSVMKWSWLNLR